jgi:hypothetical protein
VGKDNNVISAKIFPSLTNDVIRCTSFPISKWLYAFAMRTPSFEVASASIGRGQRAVIRTSTLLFGCGRNAAGERTRTHSYPPLSSRLLARGRLCLRPHANWREEEFNLFDLRLDYVGTRSRTSTEYLKFSHYFVPPNDCD